jgi:hypothetical protein
MMAIMLPDLVPEAAIEPENEFDRLRRLALEAEKRGEAVVMRDPKIRKCPPKKPTTLW